MYRVENNYQQKGLFIINILYYYNILMNIGIEVFMMLQTIADMVVYDLLGLVPGTTLGEAFKFFYL